eukprot:7484425-Prorocentrum_lima.AAC.1
MTSSLVGSEMCIRDSASGGDGDVVGGVPGERHANGARRSNFMVQKIGAVSYTHLTLPTICSV